MIAKLERSQSTAQQNMKHETNTESPHNGSNNNQQINNNRREKCMCTSKDSFLMIIQKHTVPIVDVVVFYF